MVSQPGERVSDANKCNFEDGDGRTKDGWQNNIANEIGDTMNLTAVKELVKRLRGEVDSDREVIKQVKAEIVEANKLLAEMGIYDVEVTVKEGGLERNGEAVFLMGGLRLGVKRDYRTAKIELCVNYSPLAECDNPQVLALYYPFIPQVIELARQKLNEAANSVRAEKAKRTCCG